MKKEIICIFLLLYISNQLFAQELKPDSLNTLNLKEVVIQSNRIPVLLKNNPGSVSLVTAGMLSNIPKSIGIEESLRLVPGVRIDNQHDGERVHVSI
jgi:outer membrane receptor for ferrienterochelin and colicin